MPMIENFNNPGYSRDREFSVILEDLRSQFSVFGEGLEIVQNDLETVKRDVQKLTHLPHAVKQLQGDFYQFKSFVEKVLPEVATKDDLKRLEKRLEKRIVALEAAH